MKFFPPNGNLSTHIGSIECEGLIAAKKLIPCDKDKPRRGRNIDQK